MAVGVGRAGRRRVAALPSSGPARRQRRTAVRIDDGGRRDGARQRLLHELPQRVDFLRERAHADVVVVHFLADDAQVFRQVVDQQLLSANGFPVGVGLLIEAGVDGLERLGQRAEHVLQQLRLLLQHPEVGHQLLVLFVRGRGRAARWRATARVNAAQTAGRIDSSWPHSFRRDDEVRAAVLRPRAVIVARIERELLAVAHGLQAIGRNSQ